MERRLNRFFLATLILLTFWFSVLGQSGSVSPEKLKNYITYLASDELEGRLAGSPGGEKAQKFFESKFKELGLEPFKDLNGYFQYFSFTASVSLDEGNEILIDFGGDNKVKLEAEKDFIPASFSEDCSFENLDVAFAGYGIKSQNPQRNDYEGVDVKGKVVVVLRDGPDGDDPKSPFAPFYPSRFKATIAREMGAKALIVVSFDEKKDELPKMRTGAVAGSSSIVVASMKREFLKKMFEVEGKSFPTLEELKKPSSLQFSKVKMSLKIKLKREKSTAANVVGLLKATSPSDEYLVIGGHWDHLGRGIEGSLAEKWGEVHHGADDNASGSAGVLEVARVLKEEKVRKRNVIFIAFGAEELGGLGSVYFTKNCVVPISKIVAMINLDMIGRLREKLIVDGVGTAKEWNDFLEKENIEKIPLSVHESGFGGSDHSSFSAQKIPVLFFFTGSHSDYHTPSDTADKINYEGEAKILNFVKRIALDILNSETKPTYLETKNEKGGMASFNVYVGTVPDFTEEGKGFRILSVRPGSPAEKAGLKGGDLLIYLAGKKIENIYDYTYVLQDHKPGDEVEAIVLRDGKEVKLKIVFGSRKSSE
jgi:hypothetical protein